MADTFYNLLDTPYMRDLTMKKLQVDHPGLVRGQGEDGGHPAADQPGPDGAHRVPAGDGEVGGADHAPDVIG